MIKLAAHATLSAQGLFKGTERLDEAPAGLSVPPHAALMRELFADKAPRRLDRLSELAVIAAGAAMRSVEVVPERGGVFFATGQGNFSGTMGFLHKLHEKGARFASPIEFPNLVLSAPAGSLSFQFGLKGEVFALNQGRLSGLHALAVGVEALRSGRLDVALVAGAEEHSEGRTRSAELLGRADVALGEGAAALVLDRREQAQGVCVAAITMNGLPVSDGLVAAAQRCLEESETSKVDLIYTHRRHVGALHKLAEQTGARVASLCEHVGDFDVRSMLEVSAAAASIASGVHKRVLVLDADEDSGAACVLLT